MRETCAVALLVGVVLAGFGPPALAQGNQEGQLVQITEVHVKRGMRAEWEEGRKERLAALAEHDFSFPMQISVDEDGVYRQVAVTGDWEDLGRSREERNAIPGGGPRTPDAVDHVRQSILRTRPDLSYQPANPRVAGSEAGFIRYVFLYTRPGTNSQAEEVLRNMSAMFRTHDGGTPMIVTQSVMGYDAPMYLLRFHYRDVEDCYAQRRRDQEAFGDEWNALRSQMSELARRIELTNNTWRRDLSYVPGN